MPHIRSIFFWGSCSLFFLLFGSAFFVYNHAWIDFSSLEHYNPGKPTIVYDSCGKEWTRFQTDKREIVEFSSLSPRIIKAFLAAEDWHFFSHSGISIKGIIRSFAINLYNRRIVQGASTITQQLVKLLFFDSEKNFTRKIKEQILSLVVEQQFTKEKILETYLNHVYFGAGIYGIEAAAQRFWGISSKDVTYSQAAILAGIVRSPQRYCPIFHPEHSKQRRNVVLNSMLKLDFICQEEYDTAREEKVEVIKGELSLLAPHLRETLRIFLEDLVGKQVLYTGGLKVRTTIDLANQKRAEKVFKVHLDRLKQTVDQQIDGAVVSLAGKTGAIKVLIGGYNFQQSQFNRALQAKRQFGSAIKPLVYAAALRTGLSFADTFIDEPITLSDGIKEWSPKNYNQEFEGQMTMAYALSHSNNIVAVKALLEATIPSVLLLAKRCHLKDVPPYPSLALGALHDTTCQAAAMFNIFPQGGIYHEPYFIESVEDSWGAKLYQHDPQSEQVMHSKTSSQVGKVLTLALERARSRTSEQYWLSCQAMGKSGTTNDNRTCMYVGATPDITSAVYLGRDDNRSLGQTSLAIRTAFPLWLDISKLYKPSLKQFSFDSSLKEVTIHQLTGASVKKDHPEAITILIDQPSIARNWFYPDAGLSKLIR